MRGEVAASFPHRPKLILLDEPSIGLDVVAKQHIRDAIRRMNQEEGVGVPVTSHDAVISKRSANGSSSTTDRSFTNDKVSTLKRKHLTSKLVEVRYAREVAGKLPSGRS